MCRALPKQLSPFLTDRSETLSLCLHNPYNRESARERVLEAAASIAPPSPASQDHFTRQPVLPTPEPPRVQNEPPPVPGGPLLHSTSYPQGHSPAGTSAAQGNLPVHPREAKRTEQAYQAVFKALAALLPSCPIGEVPSGGGCRARAGGGVGRMHAAAMRCGAQCQWHIRALQNGIEVRTCSLEEELLVERLLLDRLLRAVGTRHGRS